MVSRRETRPVIVLVCVLRSGLWSLCVSVTIAIVFVLHSCTVDIQRRTGILGHIILRPFSTLLLFLKSCTVDDGICSA